MFMKTIFGYTTTTQGDVFCKLQNCPPVTTELVNIILSKIPDHGIMDRLQIELFLPTSLSKMYIVHIEMSKNPRSKLKQCLVSRLSLYMCICSRNSSAFSTSFVFIDVLIDVLKD